jgi:hypothetical protein
VLDDPRSIDEYPVTPVEQEKDARAANTAIVFRVEKIDGYERPYVAEERAQRPADARQFWQRRRLSPARRQMLPEEKANERPHPFAAHGPVIHGKTMFDILKYLEGVHDSLPSNSGNIRQTAAADPGRGLSRPNPENFMAEEKKAKGDAGRDLADFADGDVRDEKDVSVKKREIGDHRQEKKQNGLQRNGWRALSPSAGNR